MDKGDPFVCWRSMVAILLTDCFGLVVMEMVVTPRKPDILDPVYLRSIGMFERANLLNAGDEPWKQRGIKDELRHEYENYPRVGKVVHRRSDS